MSFSALGLSEQLVRAVAEHGYTTPTPIQMQAIPAVLAGGDLLAGAQTGTGKTAGFVLPILQRLATTPAARTPSGRKPVRVLILTPTRELAAQVRESVQVYGKYSGLTSTAVFGGVGINPQMVQLKRGVDILVATPGRLQDLHQQRAVDLSHVEILVLDEADRMLDMGFIRDIKRILALLPKKRQNLLFSATFSAEIKTLADSLLDAPAMIEAERRNSTVASIEQKVHPVDRQRKQELLAHLIKSGNWFQVLVFTRTKHGANKLAEQLNRDGIRALAIHGNKSQGARTRALAEFKDATLQVLCATDIAARGIDIDQLPYVVNYELPNVPEDYVHRIGRTGRAGASGHAISLVCIDEHAYLRDIERLIRVEIPVETIAGFEPDPRAKAQPILQRSADRPQAGAGRNQHPRSASKPAAPERRPAPQERRPAAAERKPAAYERKPAAQADTRAPSARTQQHAQGSGPARRAVSSPVSSADGNRARAPRGDNLADGNRAPRPHGDDNAPDGNRGPRPRGDDHAADGNRVHTSRVDANLVDGNRAHRPRAEVDAADGNRAQVHRGDNLADGNRAGPRPDPQAVARKPASAQPQQRRAGAGSRDGDGGRGSAAKREGRNWPAPRTAFGKPPFA